MESPRPSQIGFVRNREFALRRPLTHFLIDVYVKQVDLASLVAFSHASHLREILKNTDTELSKSRGPRRPHFPSFFMPHKVNSGRTSFRESSRFLRHDPTISPRSENPVVQTDPSRFGPPSSPRNSLTSASTEPVRDIPFPIKPGARASRPPDWLTHSKPSAAYLVVAQRNQIPRCMSRRFAVDSLPDREQRPFRVAPVESAGSRPSLHLHQR